MANGSDSPKFLSDDARAILRKSALCARLDDDQAMYFFEVVERTRLDPYTGQIRPDVRNSKTEDGTKIPTLLIIVTLQGLRSIGARSGQLDGESVVEWCDGEGKWSEVWLGADPPAAARASVYRKDRPRPQTCVCRWDGFCQMAYDRQGKPMPNPFWRRMGSHMLGKCSLAGAYRGAFPDLCSGIYISEELATELDPDSEESIEAEMVRRARAEKAYWDEQAKAGVYPVGGPPPEPPELPEKKRVEAKVERVTAELPLVSTNHLKPAPMAQSVNEAPALDTWRTFTIQRLPRFKGRTVESLTNSEVIGLKVFLEKCESNWGGVDEDLRTHYRAIKARTDSDAEKSQKELMESLTDGLDFSTPAPQESPLR